MCIYVSVQSVSQSLALVYFAFAGVKKSGRHAMVPPPKIYLPASSLLLKSRKKRLKSLRFYYLAPGDVLKKLLNLFGSQRAACVAASAAAVAAISRMMALRSKRGDRGGATSTGGGSDIAASAAWLAS